MKAIKERTPITPDALRVVRTHLSQLMIHKWWRIPRDYDEALTPSNLCRGLSLTFDDLYTILRSVGLLHLHVGGEPQQSSKKSNLSPTSSIGVNEAMLYTLPLLFPSLNLRVLTGFPIGSRRFVYYILRGTPTATTVEQPPAASMRAVLDIPRSTRLKRKKAPTQDDKAAPTTMKRASPNRPTATAATSSNQTVPVMATSQRKAPFLLIQDDEATVRRENTKQQQKPFGPWTGGGADKRNDDKDYCCCTADEDDSLLRPLEISTNLMSEIWSIPSAPLVVSSSTGNSKESVDEDENFVIGVAESAAPSTTTTSSRKGQQPKANIDKDSIDYITEGFTCMDPSHTRQSHGPQFSSPNSTWKGAHAIMK
jgi:hypothetical protein